VEVAWLRECKWCDEVFLVCRGCGFNRWYCGDECADAARRHRRGAARRADRRTDAGKEEHRDEERERRKRLRLRKQERVGDRLWSRAGRSVTVAAMAASLKVAGTAPARTVLPGLAEAEAPLGVAAPSAAPPPRVPRPLRRWRLVVGLALAARAHALRDQGTPICCVGCGRTGRVAAVVVKRHLWVDAVAGPGRREGG
jgi:hypothetical protein